MRAMILAAGFGKRLLPLTEKKPKSLIKIGDKSLIQRNIEHLINNGFNEIIINVSYLGDQVVDHVQDAFPDENIIFSIEESPLGTGGGILRALPTLGNNPFLCMNADIFHNIEINDLPKDVEIAHLIGVENPDHNKSGDFSLNNDLVEVKESFNELTWSGISVINPDVFSDIETESETFNVWKFVLLKFIQQGLVSGEKSENLWIDVGTHNRLNEAIKVYNDKE